MTTVRGVVALVLLSVSLACAWVAEHVAPAGWKKGDEKPPDLSGDEYARAADRWARGLVITVTGCTEYESALYRASDETRHRALARALGSGEEASA